MNLKYFINKLNNATFNAKYLNIFLFFEIFLSIICISSFKFSKIAFSSDLKNTYVVSLYYYIYSNLSSD